MLERIATVSGDLEKLRNVRMEIATGGTASATISAAGGSKSYTRLDLASVTALIRELETELSRLRARLNGSDSWIRRIMFVR